MFGIETMSADATAFLFLVAFIGSVVAGVLAFVARSTVLGFLGGAFAASFAVAAWNSAAAAGW